MNEETIGKLQDLLESLSRDSESVGLKNEIEELENRLSNIDYYKTPNKADGTPAQTGDFGREYRNYSSHINTVNKALNELVNKKISEITARQVELDQTVEQAQLTNDENTIEEAERAANENRAILNNLTELANRQVALEEGLEQAQLANDESLIAETNRLIEENREALDNTMMGFEDSVDKEEYQRLLTDRNEENKEHEDFLARAESLMPRDENGNVYLDSKGRPVLNVNLYNMIGDEKKLAIAKEAYANTNLGKLEAVMESLNVQPDLSNQAQSNIQPDLSNKVQSNVQPADNNNGSDIDSDIENNYDELYEKMLNQQTDNPYQDYDFDLDNNTPNTQSAQAVDPISQPAPKTSSGIDKKIYEEYNDRILKCEYFLDKDGKKVLLCAKIYPGDKKVAGYNEDRAKVTLEVADLKPTGEVASIGDIIYLRKQLRSKLMFPQLIRAARRIIEEKSSKSISEQYDDEGNLKPAELVFNDEVLAGKYFMHPTYGKVEAMSNAVYSNGNVSIKTSDGSIVEVPLTELSLTDEFLPKPTVDLEEQRKKNLQAALAKETMDGNALDRLESDGIYMPSSIKTAEIENEEKDNEGIVIPMPNNNQNIVSAVAANSVDAKGNEGDDMSKKDDKKVVATYSQASDDQKKQAKDKFLNLKKALVGAGIAAMTFLGLNALTKNNNNEPEVPTTTIEQEADVNVEVADEPIVTDDTNSKRTELTSEELDQLVRDVIAGKYGNGQDRINNLRQKLLDMGFDESVIDDLINRIQREVDRRLTGNTPVAPTVTPAPTPAPASTELTQPEAQSLYPEFYTDHLNPYTGEAVAPTHVEEHQISQDPAPEQNQQAINQINNGAGVGTTLANGQTIQSQSTSITGGELQGITTTVVDDNKVTPESVTNNNTNNNSNTNTNTNTSSSSSSSSSTSSNSQSTTTTTTTEKVTLHNGESLGSYTNNTGEDQQVEVVTEIVDNKEVLPVFDANTLVYFDADGIGHENETGGMHR